MPAPAAETVEERILDNLKTTLAGISTASSAADFYTTVKRVHRMDRDPVEVAPNELPILIVTYQEDEQSLDFTPAVNHDLKLAVFGVIAKQPATWQRDIARLVGDVSRAVALDRQRGTLSGQANAHETLVLSTVQANTAEDSPVAMARLDLLIQFRHLHNDPTAAI